MTITERNQQFGQRMVVREVDGGRTCLIKPCCFVFPYLRYSILAPSAIPEGFVEGKEVTGKVLEALNMDNDQYKLGHTKVSCVCAHVKCSTTFQ